MSLGLTTQKFDFAYRDKYNNYKSEKDLTTKVLQKKCQSSFRRLRVSVINAPTADKPYKKSYTGDVMGCGCGTCSVRYQRSPMERLKELAIAQMQR